MAAGICFSSQIGEAFKNSAWLRGTTKQQASVLQVAFQSPDKSGRLDQEGHSTYKYLPNQEYRSQRSVKALILFM